VELTILLVHVVLAASLFFLMNWIGKHSTAAGYISLTVFLRRDEAPAFNVAYRIFGPIVFVLVLVWMLTACGLEEYTDRIWLVIPYYYLGRFSFVLLTDRTQLVNWGRELALFAVSTALGWMLYDLMIRDKHLIWPGPEHMSGHIWMLVILFLFSTLNNVQHSWESTITRKSNYLKSHYDSCKARYHDIISEAAPDPLAEALVYTVLLYEGFNRPALIRLVERAAFPLSKSLGPMQVTTATRITDRESVRLGAALICDAYTKAIQIGNEKAEAKGKVFNPIGNHSHRRFVEYKVAVAYNRDDNYVEGITELAEMVIHAFYPRPPHRPQLHWTDDLI
jgi:hypothetical protein